MPIVEDNFLLTGIPKHYGIKQVFLQYELCRVSEEWLIIATQTGVLVCFNHLTDVSWRIPPQGYSKIMCLDIQDKTFIWGTDTGTLGAQQLQSQFRDTTTQSKVLSPVHTSSLSYICLHGNRIVSSAHDGTIIVSDVQWDKNCMVSAVVNIEPSKILRLQLINTSLVLLSTIIKSSIINIENLELCSSLQVGSKERKSGEFGSCVLDSYTVLVSRPGFRLWYGSSSGQVLKTIQLKGVLMEYGLPAVDLENDDKKLSAFLPKSGIISRVERLDDKLIVIQCRDTFVFLETIDLSVIGWIKDRVLDWCITTQSIVFLYPGNIIKRFAVYLDGPGPEVGEFSKEDYQDKEYVPITPEKLQEIDNFVKNICDRDGDEDEQKENVTISNGTLIYDTNSENLGDPKIPDQMSVQPNVTSSDSIIGDQTTDNVNQEPAIHTPPEEQLNGSRDPLLESRDTPSPIGMTITPYMDVVRSISTNSNASTRSGSPTFGSEKSVVEEWKENLGKKITVLGLTANNNQNKTKQLITSDVSLPVYEPDKISLSSQDTVSTHSNSTNYDEDDENIAVKIKRKRTKSRKDKAGSTDKLDTVHSDTILEVAPAPTDDVTNTDDVKVELEPESGTVDSIDDQTTLTAGDVITTESHDDDVITTESHEDDVITTLPEPQPSLDVGSILSGLANLEEKEVLMLDDLGLPGLREDDLYSSSSCQSDAEENPALESEVPGDDPEDTQSVEDSDDVTPDNLTVTSAAPSCPEEASEPSFELGELRNHGNSTTSNASYHSSREQSDTSDIYSTRSYSESTADPYDLERRPSAEYGEDPLTTRQPVASEEPVTSSPLHVTSSPLHVTSSPHQKRFKTRTRQDDNVFTTDDSWLELRGPTLSRMHVTISCLAVSCSSVWCTDNWGNVYFSHNYRDSSLTWTKLAGSKLISLSVSDSGRVVWGVTTSKRAVARFGITPGTPQGTDWSELMLEVVSLAVDDSSVWLVTSAAQQKLYYRTGVTWEDPQGEKWVPVSTLNLNVASISVSDSVVWGVLDTGKLVIRIGISSEEPLGNTWHVVSVSNVKVCHVDRHRELGWVVDTAGIVHFQCGVTSSKPRGSNLWWQISVSEQLGGSSLMAQSVGIFPFKRARTLDVKQVCTSAEGGVWLLSNYNTLHRRYGVITGHNWANISRTFISGRREQWATLSGEGAYPDLIGPVWGLTCSGDIVCFNRSSGPLPIDPPCSQGSVIEISACVDTLWAVDQSGQIHVRRGISRDVIEGTEWFTLNMSQMSRVRIMKLSCNGGGRGGGGTRGTGERGGGGTRGAGERGVTVSGRDRERGVSKVDDPDPISGGVWAVDSEGAVWYRTGLQTGQDVVQAWLNVDSPNGVKFREISSVLETVWGVDTRNSVYVRLGVSSSLPVGLSWEHVPGLQCQGVRVARGGVVALSTSQQVVYRYGTCPDLPAGNYWRKVPGPPPDGSVSLLTIIYDNGVWCQSGRNNLLYRRRVRAVEQKAEVVEQEVDEEWEVV